MTHYPHDDRETDVLPGEEWKAHPSLDYDVSSLGRVRSHRSGNFVGHLAGSGTNSGDGIGRRRTPKRHYYRVAQGAAGNRRSFNVHNLVLETFVGPRPEGHDGDHVNHDPLDNKLSNLRWRPSAENRADAPR